MKEPGVTGVPAYARDYAAGGGAIQALHAALGAFGVSTSYPELLLLSGAAFHFAYDAAAVYEPQRDLTAFDVIHTGSRTVGLNGRWLTGRPAAETLEAIAGALQEGRPALVSLYSVEGHHGYAVAVGCDPAERLLSVQAGERSFTPGMAPTVISLRMPDQWAGAVAGPRAWAEQPVFLIDRGAPVGWNAEGRMQRALGRGAALITGGTMPYHDCAGAREFSEVPLGGRTCAYGLPAYEALAGDIVGAEWLGGFDLIWRMDAQVAQLGHCRAGAAEALRRIAHPLAAEAADLCRETAQGAADLAARFWYRPSRAMTSAADVMSAAGSQPAMLFWLGLSDEERAKLAKRMPVVDTPWGSVAVVDTAPRRQGAVALVREIKKREDRVRYLLGALVAAL